MEKKVSKSQSSGFNSFKGFLFECLVAHKLSRFLKVETSFFHTHKEILERVRKIQMEFTQESHTFMNLQSETAIHKKHENHLWEKWLLKMPDLANEVIKYLQSEIDCEKITRHQQATNNDEAARVFCIGYNDSHFFKFLESLKKHSRISLSKEHLQGLDIIIYHPEFYPHSFLGLNLKIFESKVAPNTLSAGMGSFFSQYFYFLPQAQDIQDHFTNSCQQHWHIFLERMILFAEKLYPHVKFQRSSHWPKEWKNQNLPTLPGDLKKFSGEAYQHYRDLTHQLSLTFFHFFQELFIKLDEKHKLIILKSLMGISPFTNQQLKTEFMWLNENIKKNTKEYQNTVYTSQKLFAKSFAHHHFTMTPPQGSGFSFSIHSHLKEESIPEWTIVLRLKPMQEFIQPLFKINCTLNIKNESETL